MREKSKRFKMLVRPVTRRAARKALVGRNRSRHDLTLGRFTVSEVDALIEATWRAFDDMNMDVSHEPTFGSRMNVQLAAVTLAFYQSLLASGVSKEEAIELVGDVCWKIYQIWGKYGQFMRRWFIPTPSLTTKKAFAPMAAGRWLFRLIRQVTGHATTPLSMASGLMWSAVRSLNFSSYTTPRIWAFTPSVCSTTRWLR